MRRMYTTLLALSLIGIAGVIPTARAQQDKVTQEKGVLGYLNPKTGAFTPMAQNVADAEVLATITPTTGKFVFNFSLNVLSTVPKNAVVSCEADVTVTEATTGQIITETVGGTATKGTGTTWTCSLTMPYSWVLSTPTSDTAEISADSSIIEGYEVTATNGTGTLVSPVSIRTTRRNVGSIKVPATGATTTEAISMTM